MRYKYVSPALSLASLAVAAAAPAGGQAAGENASALGTGAAVAADRLSYADVADLYLSAPIVATVRIARASRLPNVAGAAAASTRLYLEGDVVRLIRAPGTTAARIAWIADVPLDPRGRVPRLVKSTVVLAALPVADRPGEVRLAARDAMQGWSAPFEARVAALVAAGLAPDAPPRVTGIASAFHVAGNLPGEGETQIFLTTARAQPVSLTVLSRPGQAKRWAVALGEIVDEAAAPPAPDTLGWYRLACSLPPALPGAAVADLAATDAEAARSDYAFVIRALGTCARTRR